MAVLIYPFLALAAVGFVALLAIHCTALFGATYLFEHWLKFLVFGLFIVWLPTVLVMGHLTREFKQKDIWRAALRGCPQWLRRSLWILFGYAWVGFFVFPMIYGGGMDLPANKARSMSGVLLAFYSIAACVLYSATRVSKVDGGRRCVNSHGVSPLARYCEECGAPVQAVSKADSDH